MRCSSEHLEFSCFGHTNLLGTHRNTFEFTKEPHLTRNGDCIIGVSSDFEIKKTPNFKEIKITLQCDGEKDEIKGVFNPLFQPGHEMVFRKSDFSSERTFAVRCDKSAAELKREIIKKMKDPSAVMKVRIEAIS